MPSTTSYRQSMMPRHPSDPRDLERMAIHALGRLLARLFRGRRNVLVLAIGLALGMVASPAAAERVQDDALLASLPLLDASRLDEQQRRTLAQVARRTRNPKLAAMAVDTLRKVGDRESLPLLDAIAGGRMKVPKIDADALSVQARLASADVRMRVAERTIFERLRSI